MKSVSAYEAIIYKNASELNPNKNDQKPNDPMALSAIKGAATGVLGSAATLGGASVLLGDGIASKGVMNAAKGAAGAFDPSKIKPAFNTIGKFRNSGDIGKGLQLLTNGKGIAKSYGTAIGAGAGIIGAGVGLSKSMKAKKNYNAMNQLKSQSEQTKQAFEDLLSECYIEKHAGIGGLVTSFATKSLAKRVAIGGGIGAGIGALTAKPTIDSNGNAKVDRFGSALKGATFGALSGGMMSASKPAKIPKTVTDAATAGATTASSTASAATSAVTNAATNAAASVTKPSSISDIARIRTRNIASPVGNVPRYNFYKK